LFGRAAGLQVCSSRPAGDRSPEPCARGPRPWAAADPIPTTSFRPGLCAGVATHPTAGVGDHTGVPGKNRAHLREPYEEKDE